MTVNDSLIGNAWDQANLYLTKCVQSQTSETSRASSSGLNGFRENCRIGLSGKF